MKSLLQDQPLLPKTLSSLQILTTHFPNVISSLKTPISHSPNPHQKPIQTPKTASPFKNPTTILSVSSQETPSPSNFPSNHTHLAFLAAVSFPFPSLAAEMEQVSEKINIESIVVSIDDFFNRNPFFVAGVAFIWLAVIPLAELYLRKYKFVSAIDGFRKLRDDPNSQLLDIRKKQSVMYMGSPNLKILNKNAVQVEFAEGEEERFVKEVLRSFRDPGNTVVCVLDNFDGNSLKVAELLFKSGFKEAYAIKGGLRGKDGWQAIQETLLPPSVHVYPQKNSKSSTQAEVNSPRIDEQDSGSGRVLTSSGISVEHMEKDPEAEPAPKRPSSPFPNYPDLKPPSSPTPSKPQS